ncbi:Transposase IS116/IS110/IS902 family protein [Azotobacter beijerinckii]|uniref:Transposase IS116/IS110/IS902 family protein n=1 Tax=Azotobacter beijerinckii TaxID=170623 RepID=A0A1H6TBW3_9GAMM|nr:Transposase IS116/IS110/IS902 family protein [Azotobacter beijerinckii]
MRELLAELSCELDEHDARLSRLDDMIQRQAREDERVGRLLQVEGIGPITATALVSAVGDARQFSSAQQFAAWLGLVPRQHSSGGKQVGGCNPPDMARNHTEVGGFHPPCLNPAFRVR